MAPEYLGRGEARRSMDLLWGRSQPATRGPKAALDAATIVRAAIELADAEGLEAVSMRRVAERLEMGTMSLYTYVPGKGELLDLMVDTVYAEQLVAEGAEARDLRSRLETLAREQWAFFQRHPWTLSIASGRSVLRPNEAATGKAEAEWWTEREAILNEVMTAERFPVLDRLAADGGFDVPPDTENYNVRFIVDDFEFGLQRMLD